MIWRRVGRCDPGGRALADRHYSRQNVGADGFVPPGRCAVFTNGTPATAVWATSWPFKQYVRHAWGGAWICSIFRNESGARASDMICEAVAATIYELGPPPELGMVTFIDRAKVKPIPVRGVPTWGYSYMKAGFKLARCPVHDSQQIGCSSCRSETVGGLLALQLLPENMPAAEPPLGGTFRLFR